MQANSYATPSKLKVSGSQKHGTLSDVLLGLRESLTRNSVGTLLMVTTVLEVLYFKLRETQTTFKTFEEGLSWLSGQDIYLIDVEHWIETIMVLNPSSHLDRNPPLPFAAMYRDQKEFWDWIMDATEDGMEMTSFAEAIRNYYFELQRILKSIAWRAPQTRALQSISEDIPNSFPVVLNLEVGRTAFSAPKGGWNGWIPFFLGISVRV